MLLETGMHLWYVY